MKNNLIRIKNLIYNQIKEMNIKIKVIKNNKLSKKLIIAISSIVLISVGLIAIIMLTQYRSISLKQTETDLLQKSEQIANLGETIFNNRFGNMPLDRVINSINRLTDSEYWIVSINGEAILSTSNRHLINQASDTIVRDMNKMSNESIVSYNYSKYFGDKTLTVITPIIQSNDMVSVIFLHKNVSEIYSSYDSFIILIFISIIISLTLSIAIGIIYFYRLTRPIERMTKVASLIGEGNYKEKTNIIQDDELGMLAKTIDDMSEKIDSDIESIRKLESSAKQLVANVSHEFKTPLTLIRGYVENMQDGIIKPKKDDYKKILKNTSILENLINELLDLSKYQSGNIKLNMEKIEINQLVNDVVSDMKIIAKDKNIEINIINSEENIIDGDYMKLRQLLTIFIDNAIKYSESKDKVDIILKRDELLIRDYGIGMIKKEVDKIFDRFYQVDNNRKGYGLGLCIAKYIIDMHNFDIIIKSKKNKGTTIIIKYKKVS